MPSHQRAPSQDQHTPGADQAAEGTTQAPAVDQARGNAAAVPAAPGTGRETPTLDAAGQGEEAPAQDAAAQEQGDGLAGADPNAAGGGGGAPGGPAAPAGPDAPVDAQGGEGGGDAQGQEPVAADADVAMGEEGGAPAGDAGGGGGGGGGAPAAPGGGGGAPGGGGGGGGGGRGVTRTEPVAATAAPSVGINRGFQVGSPSLTKEQSAGVTEGTGRDPAAHQAAANAALGSLRSTIEGLQAAIAAKADGLAAQVAGALSALSAEVQAGIAQGVGGLGASYEGAKGAVEGARAAAHTTVDGSAAQAISELDTSLTTHKATLAQTCVAAQEQVRGLEAQWIAPFTTLEATHAARFAAAATAAAGQVTASTDRIAQAFAGGGGSAIEQCKGEKKVKAARELVARGAERIRGQGPTRATAAIQGLGHASLVSGFVRPLVARVATFQTDGDAALTRAADTARTEVEAGRVAAHARIDADAAAATAAFDADRAGSDLDFDLAGEQLESDLATNISEQDALFDETAAAQTDGYRAFADAFGAQLDRLPFLTADRANMLVAEQQAALAALHSENTGALDRLAADTQGRMTEEIRAGVANLGQMQAQTGAEVDAKRDEKVAAIGGIATAFGTSLTTTAAAVTTEMARWSDPLGTQAGGYATQVAAELEIRRTASDANLTGQLATYQQELGGEVAGFAANINPAPAAAAVEPQLREICSNAYSAMHGMGTDESKLFNALRACESAVMGNAVREMWTRAFPSSGSLDAYIRDDCNSSEQAIAFGYLSGNTAATARLELEYNMNWYGDDEAQIEAVLRSLSPEQRTTLRGDAQWAETNQRLQDNLSGTDLNVTNALVVGNDARADAYRLRDAIDAARVEGDNDALHTALAGMNPERRAQIAQEFHNVQQGVAANATNVAPVDQQAAYDELVTFATRDVTVAAGTEYERTNTITGANRDLAGALVREGNDSMSADVARFEVERTRAGGPKEANMETALYMSAADQAALRDPSSPDHAAAVERQRNRSAEFDAAWQRQYGQTVNRNAPANVQDALRGTYANADNAQAEIQAHQYMLADGTNSPRVVAAVTQLSIDGAGTSDERLTRVWSSLTPREADEARRLWETEHGNGETLDSRLFGGTFSELSGDEALEQRKRMLGDSQYFTGEYASRNLDLAQLDYNATLGSGGGMLGVGGDEAANLQQHHTELQGLIAQVRAGNRGQAFGPDGNFLGTPEQYERYRELCAFVGINAALYRERQDSVVNAITTGIAIVGAVAAIILTGGAATPLVAAAVAAGTGVASMAVNRAFKGGRYGWETAAVDLGVTAVSAATAGAGAYFNGLNKGADGVARGIFNSSTKLGQAGGRATVAFGSGFVNSGSTTAMQDATWSNGFGAGMKNVGYTGLRGGAANAAGSFAADGVKGTSWGDRLTRSNGYLGRGAGNFAANATSGAAAKSTELGMDASTGRFKGEFIDAVGQISLEGLKSGGQGFLEGAAEVRTDRVKAARQPTSPTSPIQPGGLPDPGSAGPVIVAGAAVLSPGTPVGTPGGDVEARTVQRTQADPDVQRVVANVQDAEARASTRLQTQDQAQANSVTALNNRIEAGKQESPDGTVSSSVTRAEAQAQLDQAESNVRRTDQQVVADAQTAHTEARTVIEATESRSRGEIVAEDAQLNAPRPAAPAESAPAVAEQAPAAAVAPAAPRQAPVDLATQGGRSLGMSDPQIAVVRNLDADQLARFQAAVLAGADFNGAVTAAHAPPAAGGGAGGPPAPPGSGSGAGGPPGSPGWTPETGAAAANARTRRTLTQDQEAVLALRADAVTPRDFEALHRLEAEVDLPPDLRTPADGFARRYMAEEAASTNYGVKGGKPVTAEEHAAAVALINQQLDQATPIHERAVTDLVADTNASIAARDRATSEKVFEQAGASGGVARVDGVVMGMGMSGVGAAANDHRTGASVVGIESTAPAHVPADRTGRPPGDYGPAPQVSGELWRNLGHGRMGQTPEDLPYGGKGAAIPLADVAQHPSADYARSSEMALSIAGSRDSAGIGAVATEGPVAPLAFRREIGPDGQERIVSTATVQQGGRSAQVETDDMFINSGLGPSRGLVTAENGPRAQQITKADDDGLRARGQMLSGEQALMMNPAEFAGQDILGIGGGPTSVWAMAHARAGGAASTEVAGQMPRPDPKSELGGRVAKVEADIKLLLAAGARMTPQGDQPASQALINLQMQHHALIGRHVEAQEARVAALERDIAAKSPDDPSIPQLRADIAGIQRGLDPFSGSRVNRNEGTLQGGTMRQLQMDVTQVRPMADGSGKVEVWYADGSTRVVDRVIPSIGADPDAPGGLNHMLQLLPKDVKFRAIVEGGRPVGFESVPPGIRIAGAAATGTLGTPPSAITGNQRSEDPADRRMTPAELEAYVDGVNAWANRDEIDANSRGIVPGIANVGDNSALMQENRARADYAAQEVVFDEVVRLQQAGTLSEADAEYIVAGRDAREMRARLRERQPGAPGAGS